MDKDMKVTVYHREMTNTGFDGPMTRVAVVEAPTDNIMDALEYAFRWTNNVMGSWSRNDIEDNGDFNENVTRVAPLCEGGYGLRSTSVGDIMYVDYKNSPCYEVMPMGFRCVSVEEDAA